MARTTIDFGIDLGTTNSAIALLKGTRPEVFRNNEGFEYTPSAVHIDPKGKLHIGQFAKQRIDDDEENTCGGFKRTMGTDRSYTFARSGRRFTSQQLSAEVLKSLKGDAEKRLREQIQAAVITIPAAFELPQCKATREAAELAGFVESPLLQEPVAAALAYGFQSESDRVFWLVYDFGGGTFDAALVHMRDGSIQVVNHGGDNNLGGTDIDRAIVDEVFVPRLVKDPRFSGLRRGLPQWQATIAKLGWLAEATKIRLSREDTVDVLHKVRVPGGEDTDFECEITRRQLERLAEPLIIRSINICKKVLADRRLGAGDVEKLVLVGGPTLTPYLQARLEEELRIPLEFDKDPLTVVSQGAAIFAATQRLGAAGVSAPAAAGEFDVQLEYKPVGADAEPFVGGQVTSPDAADLSGFTIEFINAEARPEWRSGKVGLGPTGGFMTSLWAEKGRLNTFAIELRDRAGRLQTTSPRSLTYMIGIAISDSPLVHSLGVALANNEVLWLLRKGTSTPGRGRGTVRTVVETRRGQTGVIRIPLLEGDNPRADRNNEIGRLEVTASQIKRDVPIGSEVEVTVEVDASRILRAKAYFEILDEEFEANINFDSYRQKAKATGELRADLERQKKRLEEARGRAANTGEGRVAAQALQRIDGERMVFAVEGALEAAQGDADAAEQCLSRLIELRATIDEVEDALEWPATVAEAEKEIEVERKIIADPGNKATAEEKAQFAALEREIRDAIKGKDGDTLKHKLAEMDRLGLIIMFRRPEWWIVQFQNLEKKKHTMTNESQADQFFNHGRRAIQNNDVEGLKSAVQQLYGLLPPGDADRQRISDVQ